MEYAGVKMGVNYGTNRVLHGPGEGKFPVRGRFKLAAVRRNQGGVQMTWECTIGMEGYGKGLRCRTGVARLRLTRGPATASYTTCAENCGAHSHLPYATAGALRGGVQLR